MHASFLGIGLIYVLWIGNENIIINYRRGFYNSCTVPVWYFSKIRDKKTQDVKLFFWKLVMICSGKKLFNLMVIQKRPSQQENIHEGIKKTVFSPSTKYRIRHCRVPIFGRLGISGKLLAFKVYFVIELFYLF